MTTQKKADNAGSFYYVTGTGAGTAADPFIETMGATLTGGGDATAANQTTQITALGSLTETAPITDIASSGINGRLQRIAQRLTTAIAGIAVSAITAGETHIGEVTGQGKAVTVALTVSTTPAYTAGDSIGGKITIANAVRVSGGVSVLASIQLLDRANQKPTGTILIYNTNPVAATLTDNAAVVNSTDDLFVVATISVASTDWITINSKAYANLRNLAAEVMPITGTSLYASFTVTNTPTFVATTDMQMVFGFVNVN